MVQFVSLGRAPKLHMQEERESEGGRREKATAVALEMRRKK